MEKKKEKFEAPNNIEHSIAKIDEEIEREKEEKLVNLIIEIVVSSTLKEYYETSDKIPKIQSIRTE